MPRGARFANTPTLTFSEREHTMSLDHTDEKNAQRETIKLGRELLAIRGLAVQLLKLI